MEVKNRSLSVLQIQITLPFYKSFTLQHLQRETNYTFIKYTHTTIRSIYTGIFLLYIFGCDCRKQLDIRKSI